jgi:hypothetical protein
VVVVAVEEVLLLVTVDRVVGGIDVEDEFGGRRLERRQELVDEDRSDAEEVGAADAVLEAAESRGRGELGGAADFGVVGGGLPERIAPQETVVVEVLVAGGEPEDELDISGLAEGFQGFPHTVHNQATKSKAIHAQKSVYVTLCTQEEDRIQLRCHSHFFTLTTASPYSAWRLRFLLTRHYPLD